MSGGRAQHLHGMTSGGINSVVGQAVGLERSLAAHSRSGLDAFCGALLASTQETTSQDTSTRYVSRHVCYDYAVYLQVRNTPLGYLPARSMYYAWLYAPGTGPKLRVTWRPQLQVSNKSLLCTVSQDVLGKHISSALEIDCILRRAFQIEMDRNRSSSARS